eukprot:471364-Pelagomonas_calceolata.AAC.2
MSAAVRKCISWIGGEELLPSPSEGEDYHESLSYILWSLSVTTKGHWKHLAVRSSVVFNCAPSGNKFMGKINRMDLQEDLQERSYQSKRMAARLKRKAGV